MNNSATSNAIQKSNIRKLIITQVLSGFSQWIDIFLIFSIPAFLWKAQPQDISLIAMCLGLPSLFLGPFIGAVTDRTNPIKMAIYGSIARSTISLSMAFTTTLEVFAIFTVAKGIANLCYWPATAVITNNIVNQEHRISYYSSLSALDQITKIVTPLGAGLLAILISSQHIFIISAAITLLCPALLFSLSISSHQQHEKNHNKQPIFRNIYPELKSLKELPQNLLAGLALSISMSFTLAIYDPHMAAYLNQLNLGQTSFSLIVAATAGGAVTGAIFTKYLFNQFRPKTLMQLGIFLFFTALSSVPFASPNAINFSVIWFFNGMGYEIFLIGSSVNNQNLCPKDILGRVSTSTRSLQMLATVTAPIIGTHLIINHNHLAPFIASAFLSVTLFFISFRLFTPKD